MTDNQLSVHPTSAKRIQTSQMTGWEFSCQHCAYRARFTYQLPDQEPQLEIIHHGDPMTRHTGSPELLGSEARSAKGVGSSIDNWLTPALRAQLEEILRRADFGD